MDEFSTAFVDGSSSGESRATSRTLRERGQKPETPWLKELGAARQRRAGQPPELLEEGGQSQSLPGYSSSRISLSGEQGSLKNSQRTGREPETPWRSKYDTRLHPCKQGDVIKSQERLASQSLGREVRRQASSLRTGGHGQVSGEQLSLQNSQREVKVIRNRQENDRIVRSYDRSVEE